MIYPPITNLIEKTNSRYSLVIATAKRAREISEDETKNVTKPVIEAIREIND
ncbi:MAG: DNA-directed RNA polymerase subunit omega, partial [Clostridia bacterium]|nr:DNA-directed RNA polymerase subunit omega [Clostridia bacterium]